MPGSLIIDKDLRAATLPAAAGRGSGRSTRTCRCCVRGLLALFIRRACMLANQRAVRALFRL